MAEKEHQLDRAVELTTGSGQALRHPKLVAAGECAAPGADHATMSSSGMAEETDWQRREKMAISLGMSSIQGVSGTLRFMTN